MVEAIRTLNTRLEPAHGVRLAVRLGIHTGLVVVGTIGSGGRQEQLALGETPNIAARLQGLAEPDTVVISEATAHLIHGYFVYQPLGAPALKGVTDPPVYQGRRGRVEADPARRRPPRGLTPWSGGMKGASPRRRWTGPPPGWDPVVLLSGEAGIGKSHPGAGAERHRSLTPGSSGAGRYHRQSYPLPRLSTSLRRYVARAPRCASEPADTGAALTASGMVLSGPCRCWLRYCRSPVGRLCTPRDAATAAPASRHKTLLAWLCTAAQRQPVCSRSRAALESIPHPELLSLLMSSGPWRLCLVLTARPGFTAVVRW